VARVEALLRRVNAQGRPANRIVHKDLALDLDKAVVTIKNKPVNLRRKEYELLVVLLQKRGHLLNRDFLTEAVWHSGDIVTSNTVSSHIKNLRAKLGAYGDCIETVVGLGYRFKDE
jgi:DNA-binding response OmpR family regulator